MDEKRVYYEVYDPSTGRVVRTFTSHHRAYEFCVALNQEAHIWAVGAKKPIDPKPFDLHPYKIRTKEPEPTVLRDYVIHYSAIENRTHTVKAPWVGDAIKLVKSYEKSQGREFREADYAAILDNNEVDEYDQEWLSEQTSYY